MKTPITPEAEFLHELVVFRNEVTSALKFLYTELAIHEIASKDKKVLEALNYSPTFWNTILDALQHSTFITLGRIFDNDGRNNIGTLLKSLEKNKDIFTKVAFAERWMESSDRKKIDAWLPEYLKTIYVPTVADIKKFKAYIAAQKDIYIKLYKPIRNHFGHRLHSKSADIEVLFSKVKVRNLEKFCVILHNIHEALWQLYHNGRGSLLPIKSGKYSTKNILKTKHKPYTHEPLNAQFIAQAKIALKLLKQGKSRSAI